MKQLPSLKRFIKDIVSDLRAGKCVFVSIPNHPDLDLRTGIQNKIHDLDKEIVELDGNKLSTENYHSPGEILCERFSIPRAGSNESCITLLLKTDQFLNSIPVIFFSEESLHEEWLIFLSSFRATMIKKERAIERTPICFISKGLIVKPKNDSGLSVHHWSGLATKMDTEFFLTFSSDQNFTLDGLLRIEIIKELSGYDWSLTKHLSQYSIEELLSPIDILKSYSENMPPGWVSEEPNWKSGGKDDFHGQQFINSAYLASTDGGDKINRRLWKAQIKIVFPLIEELRYTILDIYSDLFRAGFHLLVFKEGDRYKPQDIYELEVGALHHIARNQKAFPQEVVDMLRIIRNARNDLAHRKIIFQDYIKKIEEYKNNFEVNV